MNYQLPEFDYRTPPEIAGGPRPGRYPLVIVGGGLVGLTLAADLAARGVRSLLLDEDNTVGVRGASSRGIVYVQRTLEVMARIGIFDRIAAKGVTWSVGRVLAGREVLYRFDFAPENLSLQPPFVNLQQFYLEGFLVDRIAELGLTDLRWKNRVTGVRNHADHVELDVDVPDGRYTIAADWVVDCEGVHSVVRQQLGLAEHTERTPDRWCITDVRFHESWPNERWTWIEAPFNEDRAVWQHPMADEVWRLDFQMAPDSDPAVVARDDIARSRVQEMLGAGVDFDLVWVGAYSYRTMLMERLRHGRLLFAGDAAHATSPFGARGGNSGIGDAENLAWRLALVLDGRAPEALLDHYHHERHRAAAENVRITSRSGRFLRPRSEAEATLRHAVLQLARDHAFARPLLDAGRLCTPHPYRGLAGIGGGAADGAALPNLELAHRGQPVGLVTLLAEPGGALAAFCFGDDAETLATAVAAASLPVRVLQAERDFDDPAGHLARLTSTPRGGVALLRPDAHLAASLPDADPAALLRAARRALAIEPLPRAAGAVQLRRLTTDDLADFQAYRQDVDLGRYQGWQPTPDDEARNFLAEMAGAALFAPGHWCQLAIAEAAGGRLVGDIGIGLDADGRAAEIGFTLARGWQHRGLATAAVRAAIELLFAHTGAEAVRGITDERNGASARLMERLGMRCVETRDTLFRGEPCTEQVFELRRPGA